MSTSNSELPALPLNLSNLAVLGLRQPEEGSWSRLRALQYAQIRESNLSGVAGNIMACVVVAGTYFEQAPTVVLGGWAVLLAISLWHITRVHSSLGDVDRRNMTRNELYRHTTAVALVSLCWTAPLLGFGGYGTFATVTAAWATVAVLTMGSIVAFSAVPLMTSVFAVVTGLAACATFVWLGDYAFAILAFFGMVMASVGSLGVARVHLWARIAEVGMVEKGEVVSLLLREFEENQADWLWQIDTSRRVRSPSPRFAFALGREAEDIEGMPFLKLISGDAWETGKFSSSLRDLAERLKRRENFANLVVEVSLDGGRRWWELSGTPTVDETGHFTGYRGVGSDVTLRQESDEKIARMARFDVLTGLPNRMMVNEALGAALKYAEQWRSRCAFLMIDLDRFKAVNDSLGHQVGDSLLALVAERLRKLMSDNELCGRLGGDEFAIVIRDASDQNRVRAIANTVIEHLSAPYNVDNHTLYVGASVGSALGPRDGATVETLMRNADLALYRAKDEGGSVHFAYEPSLHADAEERRRLELSLRQAMKREELALQYQPVVDAQTEAVVSFEALLRWHSRDHGFVSPVKFIPLAEETRLIVPIGEWVLREACREATNWPPHVKVAVNVSGEQLLDPNFAATVVNALTFSGLAAHRLEIEVTESIFVRDQTTARATLEQIMGLGCSVALDDFGTGYSSLGYLRTLRFSTIKVDRSFVQGANRQKPESLAIIRAVVAMADSLGMSTTAEGVEDAAEAKLIRDLGCKKIQGYHFGRPMSADDVHNLFDSRRHTGFVA